MTVKTVPERAGLAATHTRDVYMGYDLVGHQLSARFDSLGGEGLTSNYDALGRLTSTTLTMDGASRTLGYGYDIRGFRTSLTHPDSTVFSYTPDTIGRLTALAQSTTSLRGFTYDTNGRLTASALGSGTPGSTMLGYDSIGRLNVLGHNIAGTAADVNWTFTYSPASQTLTQYRDNDSFAWTGAVAVSRTYTTNGLNQYTAAGPATFLYDANGNLTSDGTNSYTYDVENRLVSATIGGQAVSLRYDPMGRLYETVGTSTTRFLYDGDELIGEYVTAGAMLKRYVHGPAVDDPVVQYEGSGIASTALRHLLADRQGSVIGLVDSNGAIIARNTYDEYGIPKSDQVGLPVAGRFAYTGQIWLPELGMYHYKARLYSPTLGRFLQTDPIGYDDQINLYAYVGNDPVNRGDPSGKCQSTTDSDGRTRNVGLCPTSAAAAGILGERMKDINSQTTTMEAKTAGRGMIVYVEVGQVTNTRPPRNVSGELTVVDMENNRAQITLDPTDAVTVEGHDRITGAPSTHLESVAETFEHGLGHLDADMDGKSREESDQSALDFENNLREKQGDTFVRDDETRGTVRPR